MTYYTENVPQWERIRQLIEGAGRIFISTHVNPDGDAAGSATALAECVVRMGKPCRIVLQSPLPESYRFLDPGRIVESYPDAPPVEDGPGAGDIVFFVDVGRLDRVGNVVDFLAKNEAMKIVIDHHRPETVNADFIVVNPDAESTGSLIYDLISHVAPSLIDEKIATAILTALATDTGYFRYSNTTSVTHRVAASLYDHGARVSAIRRELETGQPFCRQKLLGMALSNVRASNGGKISYAHITTRMFERAGARREHTDGIIDHLRIIQGAKIAALIIQEGERLFKVSFRTAEGYAANDLASMLGGGGHPRAAGATMSGSLEQVTALMLQAAQTILAAGKE